MIAEDMVMLGILVVVNALVDTLIVLVILSKRQERMMGVRKVTTANGQTIYAPLDPDGKPIKVPIGTKELDDGKVEVTYGYAPLAYSMPFMAADMAFMKIKMFMLGQKGQISQMVKNKALAEGDMDAVFGMLPKKLQSAVAIAKLLGFGGKKGEPAGQIQVVNKGGEL